MSSSTLVTSISQGNIRQVAVSALNSGRVGLGVIWRQLVGTALAQHFHNGMFDNHRLHKTQINLSLLAVLYCDV